MTDYYDFIKAGAENSAPDISTPIGAAANTMRLLLLQVVRSAPADEVRVALLRELTRSAGVLLASTQVFPIPGLEDHEKLLRHCLQLMIDTANMAINIQPRDE